MPHEAIVLPLPLPHMVRSRHQSLWRSLVADFAQLFGAVASAIADGFKSITDRLDSIESKISVPVEPPVVVEPPVEPPVVVDPNPPVEPPVVEPPASDLAPKLEEAKKAIVDLRTTALDLLAQWRGGTAYAPDNAALVAFLAALESSGKSIQ